MNFPYGYYQLTRFLCFIGFGILAFESKEKKVVFHAIIFACLSFLFQPFYKISLGRELWNVVDLVVGVALILSIFQLNKVSQNN